MRYTLPLSLDRKIILDLPVPIERIGKRDRKKLFKWMIESVNSTVNANRIEAMGRYSALLQEADRIKREWELDSQGKEEKV